MNYAAKDTRYDTMVYNRCGAGGLKLPAMSFGLWHNFGYGSTYSNAREMVLGAFDMGITHFDLANNYGPRGIFCEWSGAEVTENPRKAARNGVFCRFCASRSVLQFIEPRFTTGL